MLETQETQIVAANDKKIKFYDFIDKEDKEHKEYEKKIIEDKNKHMKEYFTSIDSKKDWKLDRVHMNKYFKLLFKKMGQQFEHAAVVSEECFEDVWHEMDCNETGFITWH